MAAKPAPGAHRIRVREKSTGRVFEAWPVDARELVNHPAGDHELVPDDEPEATAPTATSTLKELELQADASPSVLEARAAARERLEQKSYKELQELSRRAGLSVNQKQPALIEALLPLIAAGTVSLEVVPSLQLPSPQFPNADPQE